MDPAEAEAIASNASSPSDACTAFKTTASAPPSYAPSETAPGSLIVFRLTTLRWIGRCKRRSVDAVG